MHPLRKYRGKTALPTAQKLFFMVFSVRFLATVAITDILFFGSDAYFF